MREFSAKEAKNNFGDLMIALQQEPVNINKNGKPYAVVLSVQDYRRLRKEALRDKIRLAEAQLDNGEYAEYSLEELKAELDAEIDK